MSNQNYKVEREFIVPQKGTGRPDFSGEVFRATQRPGYELQYGEQFIDHNLVFCEEGDASPFPFVRGPLADGETANLVSTSTGLPMPYTLPQGYLWRCLQDFWSVSEVCEWYLYFDGYKLSHAYYDSLNTNYYSEVKPLDTQNLDPMAVTSHTIDFRIKIAANDPFN